MEAGAAAWCLVLMPSMEWDWAVGPGASPVLAVPRFRNCLLWMCGIWPRSFSCLHAATWPRHLARPWALAWFSWSLALICEAFSHGSPSLRFESASDGSGDSDLALIMMSCPHPLRPSNKEGSQGEVRAWVHDRTLSRPAGDTWLRNLRGRQWPEEPHSYQLVKTRRGLKVAAKVCAFGNVTIS